MKQGWEIKKLGDVCIISAGQGAPQGESNYCTNGIPFVKAGNLEDLINGLPESTIQNVSDEVAKKHRLKLYKAGSVVFAKSGMSCMKGYVYALKNDCYVVSHLAILTPHSIDTFFLKYLLEFYRPNTLVKDSAYPSISLEDIKSFSVPVPSLPEQEKIVAELDCLSGIIEKKKQQLKEYDALAQSIFYEMFGNPIDNEKGFAIKCLGDIANSVNYGTSSPAVEGGKYTYLRMNNLTYNGYLDLTDIKSIDVPEKDLDKYIVRKGDILFNRTNSKELVGKTALFDLDKEMIIAGYIIRVRININEVIPIYVVRYMNTAFMKSYFANLCKGAVNQANINSKELKAIPIPVPPLSLQQEFASKIEAIEKQKELIKQSIAETETLFNSRMDYYFN